MKIVLYMTFLALFLVTSEALICYECANARSNEACNAGFNGGLRNCPSNALSCENLVRTRNGQSLYFKQCKQPQACRNNMKGNNNGPQCRPGHPIHSECWCCCEGEDRCNEAALPCLPGTTPSTGAQDTTTPQPPTCTEPGEPKNGDTDCGNETRPDGRYLIGSTCEYTCDLGYTLIGYKTTTCDYELGSTTSAVFSPSPPECRPQPCEQLDDIENGFVSCPNGITVGEICKFSCIEGYSLHPPHITETECLTNITWSNENPCCLEDCSPDALIDLVIVLDSSSSIGERNWEVMLQFTTNFISNTNVRPDAANIGVFRYNSRVDENSRIFLDDFATDRAGLINAVERIPYNGEGTLTGNALRYVRNTMFNRRNGDRPEAANVMLVITDGVAQDGSLVISQSQALRNEGVLTYAIGIRATENALDFPQLNAIAGSQDQLIILERGFEELSETLASSLGTNICRPRQCPGTPPPTCPPPSSPENGATTCEDEVGPNENYLLGSICYYSCNEGYIIDGPSSTTCRVISALSGETAFVPTPPICKRVPCDPLEDIENGLVTCPNGIGVGAFCEFSCNEGYRLYPPHVTETECLNDFRWRFPNPCCIEICSPDAMIDLVIVLDSSSSIGPSNWPVMVQFTNNFISNINVRPDAANIGVFRYNSRVDENSRIFLDDFVNDRAGLINAVERIPYNGGGTLTGNALSYARNTMFNRRNGDRPEARNVILVLTDGVAQDGDIVISQSQALRNDGVLTYAIGIRESQAALNIEQLTAIAGSPDQLTILEGGFEELSESLASSLGSNICQPLQCPVPR